MARRPLPKKKQEQAAKQAPLRLVRRKKESAQKDTKIDAETEVEEERTPPELRHPLKL